MKNTGSTNILKAKDQKIIVAGVDCIDRRRKIFQRRGRSYPLLESNYNRHVKEGTLILTENDYCFESDILDRVGKELYKQDLGTGRIVIIGEVSEVTDRFITPKFYNGNITSLNDSQAIDDYIYELSQEKGPEWLEKIIEIEKAQVEAGKIKQAEKNARRGVKHA